MTNEFSNYCNRGTVCVPTHRERPDQRMRKNGFS
uniref:Uncharacterized protein n=1 Tax=Arundo donax TaxID=35708 RepID=A0A0A8ZKA3_ARUDO